MSDEDDMDRNCAGYTNMMLIMKCLIRKRCIDVDILRACIDKCILERLQQCQQLKRPDIDFDADKKILYTAMKLYAFTELEMITDKSVIQQLCTECDAIVMAQPLDLARSHTFLGKKNHKKKI